MQTSRSSPTWLVSAFALSLLLGSCTSYSPLPLPSGPNLAPDVFALKRKLPTEVDGRKLTVDPSTNLTSDDVAILAVLNNPELVATRERLHVEGAQVFAAGLLPDPQFSASVDQPSPGGTGLTEGGSVGLGLDLTPLITRSARLDAAREGRQHAILDVLWQEWQVTQHARSLVVHAELERQRLALLREILELQQMRYRGSKSALGAGDITLNETNADLVSLADAESKLSDAEQTHAETEQALRRLLGLVPAAALPLAALPPEPPEAPTATQTSAALKALPQRRPDLLALEAGYASQEATVRAAILAQFPAISVGISRARDTAGVYTTGFNIGLTLPFFSGNRGAIATERATRAKLRAEYQARVDGAVADVANLQALEVILTDALAQANKTVPELERHVELARPAFQAGDLDALNYISIEGAWYAKRLERIGLLQSLWDARIALETLLALPAAYVSEPSATRHAQVPSEHD